MLHHIARPRHRHCRHNESVRVCESCNEHVVGPPRHVTIRAVIPRFVLTARISARNGSCLRRYQLDVIFLKLCHRHGDRSRHRQHLRVRARPRHRPERTVHRRLQHRPRERSRPWVRRPTRCSAGRRRNITGRPADEGRRHCRLRRRREDAGALRAQGDGTPAAGASAPGHRRAARRSRRSNGGR